MQTASSEYARAITADFRRILPRATANIVDPDIAYQSVDTSGQAYFSRPDQLYDKQLKPVRPYASCERDRFRLDGSFSLYPDTPQRILDEHGYLGDVISEADGALPMQPYTQLNVRNLSIMQAAAVHFSPFACDGVCENFVFTVYCGAAAVYSKAVTGNRDCAVYFDEFTVEEVTALRVTMSKWSLPHRRPRILEIVPGIYESWEADTLYSIDVLQETAFDCLTTPYGSCTLQVYNAKKRFNPYNRKGLFRSIEERQGIAVAYGVELADGSAEYLPLGVYYQQSGGWETDAFGLTITFKLADIIGLLTKRDFKVPDPVPTTLDGWAASLTDHLGENFKERYEVERAIADTALTADAETLKNLTCGHVLRYMCMAAGAFFKADAVTGKLKIGALPAGGGVSITADNMTGYPKAKANDSIAQITFRLADGARTEHVVNGTLAAADKSLSISNPFIHTAEEADKAAKNIFQFYGQTLFTVSGRGDMRSELGDVDTIYTGFDTTARGRRYKQQFKIANGIMKNVPSYLMGGGAVD